MAVKTITIKESAYEVLKSLKMPRESFSETIVRISKRRPLSEFYGVLSNKTGENMEKAIIEARKKRNKSHKLRVDNIVNSFKGG
jgi:predicted CopG family antitoxin